MNIRTNKAIFGENIIPEKLFVNTDYNHDCDYQTQISFCDQILR